MTTTAADGGRDTPHLRPMTLSDIPRVSTLERVAFEPASPPTAWRRELTENAIARYLVLVRGAGRAERLLGAGGLWLMLDEAHVVTVAVAPHHRRHGYGWLLVHGLLVLAANEGMTSATLEVRASNAAARALYRGFGFHEVGERRGYYADNGEDAVIMSTEAFDSPAFKERFAAEGGRITARLSGGR